MDQAKYTATILNRRGEHIGSVDISAATSDDEAVRLAIVGKNKWMMENRVQEARVHVTKNGTSLRLTAVASHSVTITQGSRENGIFAQTNIFQR